MPAPTTAGVYAAFKRRVIERGFRLHVLDDTPHFKRLRFMSPTESCIDRFDLVVWPGYLLIVGDMGEYLFRREPNMLAFFRESEEEAREEIPAINPSYWAEKCVAQGRENIREPDGAEEFYAQVHQLIGEYQREEQAEAACDEDASDEERETSARLVEEIAERCGEMTAALLTETQNWDDGANCARCCRVRAVENLRDHDEVGAEFEEILTDFWEHSSEHFTFHYLWNCIAIVWGIRQYDAWLVAGASKATPPAAPPAAPSQ